MTPRSPIHPKNVLGFGRYRLDRDGRLHHVARSAPETTVAFVNVFAKEDYAQIKAIRAGEIPAPTEGHFFLGASNSDRVARALSSANEAANAPEPVAPAPTSIAPKLPHPDRGNLRPKVAKPVEPKAPPPPPAPPAPKKALPAREAPRQSIPKPTAKPLPKARSAEAASLFDRVTKSVSARAEPKARVIEKPRPIDTRALAEAYKRQSASPPPAKRAPTEYAPSREACVKCGVPGSRGCDHYLPYAGG